MSTILLADDDHLLRSILRERLERDAHEVIECGDGFAALEIALQDRPDCLVLDVMMPLARGLEVVRQVRRQSDYHPAIAMVSARTRVTDRLNALEAGADAYLEKPVAPDELAATVARLAQTRETTRLVDLLGPVWATLAMDRLLADVAAGPHHARAAAVEQLVGDLIANSIGRTDTPSPTAMPLGVMWELALRDLIGDATDPTIPAVDDVRFPDVTTALEDADTAHRNACWALVLRRVLGEGPRPNDHAAIHKAVTQALRRSLEPAPPTSSVALWSQILNLSLPTSRAQGAAVVTRRTAIALSDALAMTAIPAEPLDTTRQFDQLQLHVEQALARSLSGTDGTHTALVTRWHDALDDVLRSTVDTIDVVDVQRAVQQVGQRT